MDLTHIESPTADSLYDRLASAIKQAIKSEDLEAIQAIFNVINKYRPAKGPSPEMSALNKLRATGYITKLYLVKDKIRSKHRPPGMYRTEMKKIEFDYGSIPLYESWMSAPGPCKKTPRNLAGK